MKEPKQETPKEAAERILANNVDGLRDALQDDDLFFFYKDVIQCYGKEMVKWQQEKMFKLVEEYNQMLIDPSVHEDHKEKSFKEWFEQFKKKKIK